MSRSANSAALEGIYGIRGRGGTDIRFQAITTDDIDRPIKQARYEFLQAHIVVNRDVSVGIDLNHNIRVAVRTIVAASARTEQSSVYYSPLAQDALVLSKPIKNLLLIHSVSDSKKCQRCQLPRRQGSVTVSAGHPHLFLLPETYYLVI